MLKEIAYCNQASAMLCLTAILAQWNEGRNGKELVQCT